ncbi:MAG: ABC transporter ATP-binding protein [Puniceicoccaceae bacterium]|nr:MAG: ABC transporter ATP-binding protein [Puniceicoccaceae bacterium]
MHPSTAPSSRRSHPNTDSSWSRLSLRQVPEPVTRHLAASGFHEADSLICLNSRMNLKGRFQDSWFVADRKRAAVFEANGRGFLPVWEAPVERILEAKMAPVTGGGMLVVRTDQGRQEVMRFDAGQAALFGGLAHCLNKQAAALRDAGNGASAPAAVEAEFDRLLKKQRELTCSSCTRQLPRNTRVCPFCIEKGSTLLRILSYARPYAPRLVLMMALMVIGTGVNLIPPQITRILIDDVLLSPEQADRLPWLVLALAGVMVTAAVIGIIRARVGIWVGCHVTNDIQASAFNHLQALSLSYFNKQQTGALMSRVNNDARQMQGFLVDGIQYTVVNLLTIVGIAAVLIWMNPLLGILVILPGPVVVLLSAYVWRRIHRRFRLLWVAMASVTSYLNDALSGIRVIKSFGKEEAEIDRFGRKLAYTRGRTIDAEQTWQTLVPILNLIVQSSLVLVWYFGAYEVYGERLTIGGLVAFIGYLGMIYGPLQLLTRLNDWLSRSLTAAARVFEVLDTEAELSQRPNPTPLPEVRGEIELRDVTFGYERHDPVIKNLSLKIAPGEMIGLVGKSGAGKSTLINLIGRLYDPDEGAVLLDGLDLRDIRVEDLRRQIGFVLQDNFLFSGTIADNIAYARPNASHEQILEAAVSANAHTFIMNLPDGYDTYVGERGTRLSGGERQRIAIARALLQNPRILILDEATSSVDTETEAKIQQALGHLVAGRTTIAIAHRLSTLRHANRLVVMDEGRIAEVGTHAELMAMEDGVYRKLVTIQTEWSRVIGIG